MRSISFFVLANVLLAALPPSAFANIQTYQNVVKQKFEFEKPTIGHPQLIRWLQRPSDLQTQTRNVPLTIPKGVFDALYQFDTKKLTCNGIATFSKATSSIKMKPVCPGAKIR